MKVGIKYCGGCNPMYDRGEYVQKLIAKHQDWEWEYAQEGVKYDHLAVIGGCGNCCASHSQYDYDTIKKHFPTQLEEV